MIRRKQSLAGWITVEVILSLALLALVLDITQRQMAQQWQMIEQRQAAHVRKINQQHQQAMTLLTGGAKWREMSVSQPVSAYPRCQLCAGDALRTWFRTAQTPMPAVMRQNKTKPGRQSE